MAIKDLLKQIKRDDDLIMAIDQYYEFHMEQSRDDSGAFHPSAAGDCHMKIAYAYLGYDRPKMDALIMRKIDNGTWMHKRYEHTFIQMSALMNNFYLVDLEIPIEVVVRDSMTIKGHADAIIELNAKKLLIEMKSIRSELFYKLGNEPHPEYVAQWMIYSDCLSVYEGRIVYENKNDQTLRQYKMFWDADKVRESYDKLWDIYSYVSQDKLPPRPKGVGIECTRYSGCQWYNECWGKIE